MYKKQRPISPYYVVLVIIIWIFIVNKCEGQCFFELEKRDDGCENYEKIYLIGDYYYDIYSVSWEIFYDSCNWDCIGIGRSDIWIDGYYLDSIYKNKIVVSWFNLMPLVQDDTLLCFYFRRKGYIGGGDLEWSADVGRCQVTDYNGYIIAAVYEDGWLRCISSGVGEFELRKKIGIFVRYNILGQEVR